MNDNNRAIINKINKRGNGDTLKVIIIMLILMIAGGFLLWFIGGGAGGFAPVSLQQEDDDEGDNQANQPETTEPTNIASTTEPIEDDPALASIGINYQLIGGDFELPLYGATGWVAAATNLRSEPLPNAPTLLPMPVGQSFVILETRGEWWYVEANPAISGWVDRRRCFINIPDVIPSIIYLNTNASASVMMSYGYPIPNITGYRLYNAHDFNERFGRYEYIIPGQYTLARALFIAQQHVLANGETLVVNEVFRPFSVQQDVVRHLQALINQDSRIRAYINQGPWHIGWFIATGVSGHQRGSSIDLSIATILSYEYRQVGDFRYKHIYEYRMFPTTSRIHELGPWAAIVYTPRSITANDILRGNITLHRDVTEGVRRLQLAMATAGFNLLSSEWWHFDHPESSQIGNAMGMRGQFYTEESLSWPPVYRG